MIIQQIGTALLLLGVNMTIQQIDTTLLLLPAVIAMLVFILIICLGKTYRPMAALHKTYIRIDGILHEQKKFFDYEAVNRFLVSHGAAAHFGKWIDPVKYMGIRICIGAAGFVIGAQYHPAMGLVGCVIGFFVPKILLIQMNSSDNLKMTPQIQTLYSLLQVQIRAGIPVTEALIESYQSFPRGRLREALQDFAGVVYVSGSFDTALEDFSRKFQNGFIDSLCVILMQSRESGQAMELLRDISQQITDMQSAVQIKRKEKLDRTTTLCLLGIISGIIIIVLYAFLMQMYQLAAGLF